VPAKVIAALAVVVLLGCKPQADDHQMNERQRDAEEISKSITHSRFDDLVQLKRHLDEKGVKYTILEENDPNLMVVSASCRSKIRDKFRFFFLKLNDVPGPKLYRYGIYQGDSGPLCIEPDFSYKNPYQS
jgi:hypothetical protein